MNSGNVLKKIFSLGRVFWDSQVFLCSVKLRVYDFLSDWSDSSIISKKLKLDMRATEMLLDALASLGFLLKKKKNYKIKNEFAPFLLSNSQSNVLSILDHYYHMWDDWGSLIESLRTGKPVNKVVDDKTKRMYTKAFITGMDNLTKFQKDRLIENLNLNGVKSILDIGSGPATYLREILKKNGDIVATIVDLPVAAEVGKEFIKKDNLNSRVKFLLGDIRDIKIDRSYDCIFIFQVLHALNMDTRKIAIKKSFEALNKGGRIYIHEFYLNETKTSPKDSVIFRLNMLLHAPGGDNLTTAEIKELLREAGFDITKVIKFKNPSTVLVEGTKK